jgi:hypothetical protein
MLIDRRPWAILALITKIHISIPVYVAAAGTAAVAVVGHRRWEDVS